MQVRNTNQRKLILDLMAENYTHPTADELYEKARAIDAHISRGTVYRNLAFLAESGEILKITVPNGPDHYDCTITKHYHFCCTNCQKMYDVSDKVVIELDEATLEMKEKGFFVAGHNLNVFGLYPACNE